MDDKQKTLKRIIKDILFIYLVSFVVLIIVKTGLLMINEENLIEPLMLTFRSYLLGTITTEETIFDMMLENIGLFVVHFTVFFALIIMYFKLYSGFDKKTSVIISLFEILVGMIFVIFMRERFIFCIPFAMVLSGIMYILYVAVFSKIKINDKILLNINRLFFIIISIVSISQMIIMSLE